MQAGPGSEETGVEVWSSASWRERAVGWLDEQLATAGLERTGEVAQPNLRPWATVLRAPTAQGPVWLKASAPGTAFEVGLYRLLHQVVPDQVLTPIAADATRGWIVLPDGGRPLGERLAAPELADALEWVLPEYGQRVVAHPFSSMLVALVFVESDGRDDDPQLVRVRDAYLEASCFPQRGKVVQP